MFTAISSFVKLYINKTGFTKSLCFLYCLINSWVIYNEAVYSFLFFAVKVKAFLFSLRIFFVTSMKRLKFIAFDENQLNELYDKCETVDKHNVNMTLFFRLHFVISKSIRFYDIIFE